MTTKDTETEARELLAQQLEAHHFQSRAALVRRNEQIELPSQEQALAAISDALRQRDEAVSALKPFAQEERNWLDIAPDDQGIWTIDDSDRDGVPAFTLGDVRRAAAIVGRK